MNLNGCLFSDPPFKSVAETKYFLNLLSLIHSSVWAFHIYLFIYFIYLYRDNAQQKCCAKVSYKANKHLQSLCRMLLQQYSIKNNTTHTISHHTP